MFRRIIGYAALAVVGVATLQFVLGLGVFLIAILIKLLWLAALGFVFYWVLKAFFPDAAARVREVVGGRSESEET